MTRRRRALPRAIAAAALALVGSTPTASHAWDPSTTHAALTRRAVVGSAVQVRWMDGSDLQRGIFSPIRVDPARLTDDDRRRILRALRTAHAASGAAGLGGPGACPGASAPMSTRAGCVDGDLWELSALGWIQLGVVAEVDPRDRLLHHFVSRTDPGAKRWSDRRLARTILRLEHRRAGATLSERMAGTAFGGKGGSAIAWLEDPDDPWAPPRTMARLRVASTAEDPVERANALALGMIGMGALLHVVQDLAVPAHARGDVAAFFSPLSRTTGDRGLPLQEFVRVEYGRARLPTVVSLQPREATRGAVRSATLHGHLLGDDAFEGLVNVAGHRFLSETTIPSTSSLSPGLDGTAAAAELLADSTLDPVELEGAKLSPWPAEQGYLLSGGGRPLAAFEVDGVGQIRLYLDRRVYRDQAGHLLPLAQDVSRSLLDLLLPAFPTMDRVSGSDVLALDLHEWPYDTPQLQVMTENAAGRRTVVRRIELQARTRNRIVSAIPAVAEGERVVLVVTATADGLPVTAEHVWVDRPATENDADAGGRPAGPAARPAGDRPDETDETDASDDETDQSDDETDQSDDEPGAEPGVPGDEVPTDAPPRDDEAPAPTAPTVPAGVAPPSASTPAAPPRAPAIPKKREAPDPDAEPGEG